jgi:hypothetical protein
MTELADTEPGWAAGRSPADLARLLDAIYRVESGSLEGARFVLDMPNVERVR